MRVVFHSAGGEPNPPNERARVGFSVPARSRQTARCTKSGAPAPNPSRRPAPGRLRNYKEMTGQTPYCLLLSVYA
jgi:hypothetical protein